MPARPLTPAALLDVLIAKAPALRAAGVLFVELGEIKFQISPPEPAAVAGSESAESTDPFRDPTLYGLNRGTPGFDTSGSYDDE